MSRRSSAPRARSAAASPAAACRAEMVAGGAGAASSAAQVARAGRQRLRSCWFAVVAAARALVRRRRREQHHDHVDVRQVAERVQRELERLALQTAGGAPPTACRPLIEPRGPRPLSVYITPLPSTADVAAGGRAAQRDLTAAGWHLQRAGLTATSWSPSGCLYSGPTWSAIWLARRRSDRRSVGCHADQFVGR